MIELLTGQRTAFFVGPVIAVDCAVTSQLVVNTRPVSAAEFRRITSTGGRCTHQNWQNDRGDRSTWYSYLYSSTVLKYIYVYSRSQDLYLCFVS